MGEAVSGSSPFADVNGLRLPGLDSGLVSVDAAMTCAALSVRACTRCG